MSVIAVVNSTGDTHEKVSLAQFIEWIEGESSMVVCLTPHQNPCCEYESKCDMKHVMGNIQNRLNKFLSEIYLGEFMHPLTLSSKYVQSERKNNYVAN